MTQITLRKSTDDELPLFCQLESDPHTATFILPYSLEKHRQCYAKPGINYLTVLCDDEVVGFFILHQQGSRVEFRRVVIQNASRGIGQVAIGKMEQYCAQNLCAQRIWLDVFEHNQKAIHIYRKAGYIKIGTSEFNGQCLYIMEKALKTPAPSAC